MKNKTILLIEDEMAISRALSNILIFEGFRVIKTKDGKHGLKVALERRPDLILLDILLPEMDGISMLKKLRENEWGMNVPVIILTNVNNVNKISDALKNQVYDFLIKSDWKIEDILKIIKERLNMQK